MKPIVKKLENLTPQQYYEKHLSIVHQFLPVQLTNKEIEVLATFMALQGDVAELDRFGTQCRKIVMKKLGIVPGGLGNYLRDLISKGYISKVDKTYTINKYIIPNSKVQGYQFLIEMK